MNDNVKDLRSFAIKNPVATGFAGLIILVILLKILPGSSASSSDQKEPVQSTASPAVASPSTKYVKVGERAQVKTAFIGCGDAAEFEQFKKLQRAHDDVAMSKFLDGHDCPFLDKGTKATVEHYSLWHHAFCLRPVGNPTCVWFPQEFVGPS